MPPQSLIQAVMFDLDGLMFNTEQVFHIAGCELMRRRGLEMTRECHHLMLGRRPVEAFTLLKSFMKLEEPIEVLMEESKQIFAGYLDLHLAPMPGLFALLDHIEQRRLPKGVATSSPRYYLEDLLRRYELLERFPLTLTAEDVTQGKPNPEIYLKAAELLNVPPERMLVFEDSETGTRAAAAAGAVVISVPHEHTESQDFSTASHIVNTLADPLIYELLS